MARQFLPSLRLLVAKSLLSQGLPQSRAASLLGVTQASVSMYGSASPDAAYRSLGALSVAREDADRYVALLAEDLRRDPAYAVDTLETIWTGLLGRGAVCPAHRLAYPSLASCDVCLRLFGRGDKDPSGLLLLANEAVRLVERSRSFASVMPEVSVNIACVAGETESPRDVVAVPGRIVKVNGSARAMQPPALGASRHLAEVLLMVRRRVPAHRAVINVRYDARMEKVLRRLRLAPLVLGPYPSGGSDDPTLAALRGALARPAAPFDCVVDPGSKGIEPNLYLFGPDPVSVAEKAVRAADLYSGPG